MFSAAAGTREFALDMLILYKWLRGGDQANFRNITPIHGASQPNESRKMFRPCYNWNAAYLRSYLIVSAACTCPPEIPGLFSLQIYFCLTVVIWGHHPVRPPSVRQGNRVRLALAGAGFAMSGQCEPPMEIPNVFAFTSFLTVGFIS